MTEEQKTIKCPKCGTENSTDDKFCQECGNALTIRPSIADNVNIAICTNLSTVTPVLNIFSNILSFIYKFVIFGILPCGIIYFVSCYNIREWRNLLTGTENIFEQIFVSANQAIWFILSILIVIGILYLLILGFIIIQKNKISESLKSLERRIIETQEMINKKG